MRRILQTLGVAASILGLASCGSSSSTDPVATGNVVNASTSDVFAPNEIDIQLGQSVTWSFGSLGHTVVFALGANGAPQNIAETEHANVTRTFNTAGTFTYICSIHNGMSGTVVVGGSTEQTGSGYVKR